MGQAHIYAQSFRTPALEQPTQTHANDEAPSPFSKSHNRALAQFYGKVLGDIFL
jgi:hypothetical protein